MNGVAGLTGAPESRDRREQRLRRAFAHYGEEPTIVHPAPDISIGWCGEPELSALVSGGGAMVLAYGSAHPADTTETDGPRVDDIRGCAERLLHRAESGAMTATRFAGSFLAAVRDRNGQFHVFGDIAGNRPCYIAKFSGDLAFASQPLLCARLLDAPAVDRELEEFLLIHGFYPDGRTAYRDVRLLRAGWMLTRGNGTLTETAIPAPSASSAVDLPESDNALYDRLYDVLLACTGQQLAAGDDAGVLLGGFDSALIAALLHRLGKRVRTYSFRYADAQYNQPHTDTLAKFLGIEHVWVDITPEVIGAGLNHYAERYPQPSNWLNYLIQTTYVCERMRRDGIRYAWSGDGCDAVFLGYPGTYRRTRRFAKLPRLPHALIATLVALLGRPLLDRTLGHPYRVAMGLLRALARPLPDRAFLTFHVMDEVTVQALRRGDAPPADETIENLVHRLAQPYAGLSLERLGYAAKSLVSPNRAKLLACTDAAGVVVHAPYLHPALRAFAARIPDRLLREQSHDRLEDPGKICLMRMAERQHLLPKEIILQPKLAAIDSPIDDWFAHDLRPALDRALAGLPFSPDPRHLEALRERTSAEHFYKRHIGSTRVISDAISLLATYGAICGALPTGGQD